MLGCWCFSSQYPSSWGGPSAIGYWRIRLIRITPKGSAMPRRRPYDMPEGRYADVRFTLERCPGVAHVHICLERDTGTRQ